MIVVNGNKQAFSQIIDRYQGKVFRTIIGMVGSYPDAEDLSQEVFLKVFNKLSTYRKDSSFSTWIFRIAINSCKNFNIRKKIVRFVTLDTNICREHYYIDQKIEQNEDSKQFFKFLGSIPQKYREALILKEVEELEYKEIAAILNIELGTVKSRISRAKRILRDKLLKRGGQG